MRKTTTALSDGRRLIYFDLADDTDRDVLDLRGLSATENHSQLRYNQLLDEWVILAVHRQKRTFQPSLADCPLCPSRPGSLTEIPAADYEVVVFQNRFSALGAPDKNDDLTDLDGRSPVDGQMFSERPGVGRCEVVCFTSDHDSSFSQLTPERAALVLEAWTDRSTELAALPEVEQVFCFENRGHEIGVTLDHPHGQIYAYPYVTPRTARMLRNAQRYRARTGRNLVDDIVAAEVAARARVVASTPEWTVFVPFAPRWPYEVHFYPNTRVPDLTSLSDAARTEFPALYLDVLRRFDRLFDSRIAYISAVHQAPVRQGRDELGLHIELFTPRRAADKLKYLAGSESGMDAFAADIAPEAAAERLRELGASPA